MILVKDQKELQDQDTNSNRVLPVFFTPKKAVKKENEHKDHEQENIDHPSLPGISTPKIKTEDEDQDDINNRMLLDFQHEFKLGRDYEVKNI